MPGMRRLLLSGNASLKAKFRIGINVRSLAISGVGGSSTQPIAKST
jgi:hypothetical protein